MHIFLPELKIGDTEGFTKERDIFGRSVIGKGLTNVLSTVSDSMVVAVDGQWGSGKSTFLKMWAGELRNNEFPVVYFDAFQNDYAEDAFTAIVSEIVSLAQEKRKDRTSTGKKFIDKAVGAGKVVLRSGVKLGVKLATMGALEAAELNEVAEEIAREASEFEDKYVGELLTKQQEQKDAIESFREALATLPALLTQPKQKDQTEFAPRPLIIIIDELDRCRPLFALQILERVKHFFSVKNVHFVLGVHLAQLRNSVIVAYGPGIDARMYLQKFIHLTLQLTDESFYRHERNTTKFIDYLDRQMQLPNSHTTSYAKEYFRHLAECRNLGFRTIERLMSTLAMAEAFGASENTYAPIAIIVGLCAIKVLEPDLYLMAKAGTLRWEEIRVPLGFAASADESEAHTVHIIAEHLKFCTLPNDPSPDDQLMTYGSNLPRYGLKRLQVIPSVAHNIINRLMPP